MSIKLTEKKSFWEGKPYIELEGELTETDVKVTLHKQDAQWGEKYKFPARISLEVEITNPDVLKVLQTILNTNLLSGLFKTLTWLNFSGKSYDDVCIYTGKDWKGVRKKQAFMNREREAMDNYDTSGDIAKALEKMNEKLKRVIVEYNQELFRQIKNSIDNISSKDYYDDNAEVRAIMDELESLNLRKRQLRDRLDVIKIKDVLKQGVEAGACPEILKVVTEHKFRKHPFFG